MKNDHNTLQWNKYQKAIADDNYYYARSCIRQNFFPGSETTFLKILRHELGKNIYDDKNHTSCTGIGYHSDIVPLETTQAVVARQFSLVAEAGLKNMAISCVTSFGLYNEILATWHEFPEMEAKAREDLRKATGREFVIPENIAHTSDIIYKFRQEIWDKRKYALKNAETGQPLKIVDHIGCHYAKVFPEKGIGGAEFTKVLSGMVESWGGQIVDYPERRHCCGFGFRHYLVKSNRGYSVSNTKKKLESMALYNPDAIVANCPGCAMFMDKWQYVLAQTENKYYGSEKHGIPVLTYEELAGLVLGYNPWDLGLQMHQVDCEPLLQKMGIVYDPDDKYRGVDGKYIGEPIQIENLYTFVQ